MRAHVAILAVAAVALAVLTDPAGAAPAPAPSPGELWSEFPLEGRPDQSPASPLPVPVPRQDSTRPTASRPPAADEDASTPWLLLGLGAAAASATATLAYRRRRLSTLEPGEQIPEEAGAVASIRPPLQSVLHARARQRMSWPVADPPVHVGVPRAGSSFVGEQSPRPRLDERLEPERAAVTPTAALKCEILWWRGYRKSQFYAEVAPPLESPTFRARGSEVPGPSDAAEAAHRALVDELQADGWEADGHGEHWFSDRFRKT